VALVWHYARLTKSAISPVELNQPLAGRNQEVGNVVIIIIFIML